MRDQGLKPIRPIRRRIAFGTQTQSLRGKRQSGDFNPCFDEGLEIKKRVGTSTLASQIMKNERIIGRRIPKFLRGIEKEKPLEFSIRSYAILIFIVREGRE